jgi:hypothetical protein
VDPFSRPLIASAAIACFIGAFALTPSEVRSRIGTPAVPSSASPTPADAAIALVAPAGDPFVPRVIEADASTGRGSASSALAPLMPLSHLGPLPANLGAGGISPLDLAKATTPTVSAIVTGDHPTALVVDGDQPRVIAIGDRLDGSTVVSIDEGGVALSSGQRLTLPALGAHQ